MSESLACRVGRLVSGGFHAVLDAAENCAPEAVMQENVRELERAIDEVRTELGKVLAQKHLTAKKLADENNQHETLAEQIALAVQSGRDDLAQAGIAQQLDIEARVPVLENSLADLGSQERELDAFVAALLAKQREMQAALHDWQRSQAAAIGVTLNGTSADKIAQIARAASKSGDSFNRVMQRQGGVPVVEQVNAAALQDLADLSRKAQIEARLAALKSGK
ncbi:PspA/IM30 family protein [Kingella kingae]|uniref:PspA/IM30 family protein n=1 Tax=Kingella kingae TaxID=504 RepID=UPI000420332B|nr:PspA/IM30 family protein [Kingella kingae]MDK4624598.1 PspA/IM30 family protein [Kingella kingae]MDK4660210.1 PspA/IM30 family protein [Kingella kingae]MDK4668152.1 PspA/IM30 family protein [Kingella kingae]MDK4686423.1 PspA/IM30 family protein [Kingella kingae]